MQGKDHSAYRPASDPQAPQCAWGGIPGVSLDLPTGTRALGCACWEVSPPPAACLLPALVSSALLQQSCSCSVEHLKAEQDLAATFSTLLPALLPWRRGSNPSPPTQLRWSWVNNK